MHVGTFTPEGTWQAAAAELDALADLGITVIEMMPIADFAGRFGWGYDGVDLYAPTRLYGTPDDLRAFVDRAHALGLGVILDVVYNHLGPGRQLPAGLLAGLLHRPVQERLGPGDQFRRAAPRRGTFFVENAGYWIDEFHFDGLRLDATQDIHDASTRARHRGRSSGGRARRRADARDLHRGGERAAGHARWCGPARGRLRRRRALERRLSPHARSWR